VWVCVLFVQVPNVGCVLFCYELCVLFLRPTHVTRARVSRDHRALFVAKLHALEISHGPALYTNCMSATHTRTTHT
jgi:hypothetical protein